MPARGIGDSRHPIEWQLAYNLKVTRPELDPAAPQRTKPLTVCFAADLPARQGQRGGHRRSAGRNGR